VDTGRRRVSDQAACVAIVPVPRLSRGRAASPAATRAAQATFGAPALPSGARWAGPLRVRPRYHLALKS
jgi:hypothetical protein